MLEALRRQPFLPFRLYSTDGKSFDIRHREMAAVTAREVLVFVQNRPGAEIPDRFHMIDWLHVTRIEPIVEAAKAAS